MTTPDREKGGAMTTAERLAPIDATDETIGQNVHQLLFQRRRKQNELALVIGVQPTVLSKKLRGEVAWSARQVAAAAQFLAVEPGRLYEKVTEPYIPPKLASSTDNPTPSKPLTPMLYAVRDTDLT